MNSKQLILAAIDRKRLDRVPCDYWATPEITETLKRYLGIQDDLELWKKLRVDKIISLTPDYLNPAPKHYVGPPMADDEDIWKTKYVPVAYSEGKGTYEEISSSPLAKMDTIEEIEANYVFPKADWFDLSWLEQECHRYPDYAMECGFAAPFYIYNTIRGLEKSLLDLAGNRDYAHYVIGEICDFLYHINERLFEAGNGLIDITQVTDDFGTQENLMISPHMFDEFFRPHYRRFIKLAQDHGIRIFHHDDGAIRPLIPRLIEVGIEVLNPIQWRLSGMSAKELKAEFGHVLCFHGGVDNQRTLPFGKPKDVEREVIHLPDTLASDGTGYIIAPCHNLQPITPVENIIRMYEAAHYYGTL